MKVTVEDGTGNGQSQRVDNNKRAHVFALTQEIISAAAQNGDTYNFNTGIINLSSANPSAVAFLKNNSNRNITIETIGFHLGPSVAGVGSVLFEVIRNPNAGSIVSNEVAPDIFENKNFGSIKTITDVDLIRYKGVEADTLTDGDSAYQSLLGSAPVAYVINTGDLPIPPGASLGVKITPPTGNTSMDCLVFMSIIDLSSTLENDA